MYLSVVISFPGNDYLLLSVLHAIFIKKANPNMKEKHLLLFPQVAHLKDLETGTDLREFSKISSRNACSLAENQLGSLLENGWAIFNQIVWWVSVTERNIQKN